MELRHLRYFLAVAEEGNLTKAAQRLGIQQPPLSQQIKSLETELGISLFKRLPRGVEMTPGGKMFLHDARTILGEVDRAAKRAMRFTQGSEGRVVVGMTASAAAHALAPAIVREFRRSEPRIDLEHAETNAAELTDAVFRGRIDVAIIRAPVAHPSGVQFHRLLDEPMLAIVPIDHPAITGKAGMPKKIRLEALRDEGFILVRRPGAPGMYADLLAACAKLGFVPRIVAEVERMLTDISLVAAGFGVSAAPASMRGFHAESVAYCRISDAPQLKAPMTLVHRARETNPAASRLIALALDMASRVRRQPPGGT